MILGVYKKTLRRLEKRDLITPMRTPGGHRGYSMDDLIRVGYIYEDRKNND
ncbi:MAG: MerR family transcriptional regulator [Promethearchaeota archaeon]